MCSTSELSWITFNRICLKVYSGVRGTQAGMGRQRRNMQELNQYEHSVNNNSHTFAKLHSLMRTCSLVPQCFAWAYCRKMKTNCECWCMLMFTGTCDWVCASVDKGMRISIDLARFGVHGQVEQEDVVALSLQLGYIVDDVKDQGSVQGGSQRTNKQERNSNPGQRVQSVHTIPPDPINSGHYIQRVKQNN